MQVIRVVTISGCGWMIGLSLASCSWVSSSLPSVDIFGSQSDATLKIESTPPGAEARASNGGTCTTPCSLSVPVANELTVTYTLDGYVPQTVTVKSIPAQKVALIDTSPARLEPNPVVAELKAAPPPAPARGRGRQQK